MKLGAAYVPHSLRTGAGGGDKRNRMLSPAGMHTPRQYVYDTHPSRPYTTLEKESDRLREKKIDTERAGSVRNFIRVK